jgi:hypothetical protein
VQPVLTNEALGSKSQRDNCSIWNGGNAISKLVQKAKKMAAAPLDLSSIKLETCPGYIYNFFQASDEY